MQQRKTLSELTLKDNFMFSAVMLDPENCRGFLELVLGFPIGQVVVTREQCMVYRPEYKGVRLDIYAKDAHNTHYNVEMQISPKPMLPKRDRYYHSQLDMELLHTGCSYTELADTYVIFICDFDPFGKKRYLYSFERICSEDGQLRLEDGSRSIFLSTCGENRADISPELAAFLDYVKADLSESQQPFNSTFVRQLQSSVQTIKSSREMGERYMIFEEMLAEERSQGRAEGWLEGKAEGIAESIIELLKRFGTVSAALVERIRLEQDLSTLKRWLHLAATATSLEQFSTQM